MEDNLIVHGEYVFSQDGVEVGRSKNILTKYGRRYITEYLSGQSTNPLKDIAVGISKGLT